MGTDESINKKFNLPKQLSAFQHRNYKLFFSGQIVSLTGTWLQSVAQSWLVLQLTHPANRALIMGLVSAISALPILLFSLMAGITADKFSKRNIIIITQTSAMLLAFILAFLTHFKIINIPLLMIIGFSLGMVNAFDAPARQSFVIEMVGKDDLMNAIALNSAMFNGARVMGPAVAGIVIAWVGLDGAFFINGISFIAVIISLFFMRIDYQIKENKQSSKEGLIEGLAFIKSSSLIKSLLILLL